MASWNYYNIKDMNCTKYFEGRENKTNLLCSNNDGSGATEFLRLSITTQQLSGHDCECLPSSDLVETCYSHNGESGKIIKSYSGESFMTLIYSDSDSMPSATFEMTFVIGSFVGSFLVECSVVQLPHHCSVGQFCLGLRRKE